ncbi:hypothetical protein SAMN03159424_05762 [Pseudomonas sp. NFACC05-1]|nr:hypothetical protein SAMN03159424_05762 [Pseudomonas sp. NFACC05-1]
MVQLDLQLLRSRLNIPQGFRNQPAFLGLRIKTRVMSPDLIGIGCQSNGNDLTIKPQLGFGSSRIKHLQLVIIDHTGTFDRRNLVKRYDLKTRKAVYDIQMALVKISIDTNQILSQRRCWDQHRSTSGIDQFD